MTKLTQKNRFRIIKANQSDPKLQNEIYNYLEKCLPYTKQQMINEVNDCEIKKIEKNVRDQERILQKEINQIMPGVKEKYDSDVKRIEEQRAAHQGTDKAEHQFRNPRRKFPWNDSLR